MQRLRASFRLTVMGAFGSRLSAAVLLTSLLVAGCSSTSTDPQTTDPADPGQFVSLAAPDRTTSSPVEPLAACGDVEFSTREQTGEPDGDPLIYQDSFGAFAPPSDWTKSWELAVYADGTVIRSDGFGLQQDPIANTFIGQLDQCQLNVAVAGLKGMQDVDFGVRGITDLATTVVTLPEANGLGSIEVSVYALYPVEAYEGQYGVTMLTDDQQHARDSLVAMLDGLAEAATEPWTPTRVRVVEFTEEPYHPMSTLTWPLSATLDETMPDRKTVAACGVVDGADVRRILDESRDMPALSLWSDPYRTAMVAMAVLLPGQASCPD